MNNDWTDIIREKAASASGNLPEGDFLLFETRLARAGRQQKWLRGGIIALFASAAAGLALLLLLPGSGQMPPIQPERSSGNVIALAGGPSDSASIPAEEISEMVPSSIADLPAERQIPGREVTIEQAPYVALETPADEDEAPEKDDDEAPETANVSSIEGNEPVSQPAEDEHHYEDPFAPEAPTKVPRRRMAISFGSTIPSGRSTAESANPAYMGSNFTFSGLGGNVNGVGELNYDHRPPLELGLSVRIFLSEHLALRTGLNYTLLSSRVPRQSNIGETLRQDLHLIGIPLSVEAVSNFGRFSVYAGAGGIAEKCVSAKIGGTSFKERGLQWSLSATAGAEYMVFSRFSLFLEPELRWYLTDTSAPTFRSGKDLGFTARAGLRLSL